MKIQTETLMIPGPTGDLHSLRLFVPEQAIRGIALVAHPNPLEGGTHQNKVVQTIAKTAARLGFVAYCPNTRGVGESGGTHDYGIGETDDLEAVLNHARTQYGDLPVLLAGFSFGSFVVTRLRQRVDAVGMVLCGPAVSRYDFPTVPVDTLVLQGERDEVVPLAAVFDWARPQHLPITVLPGVGHFFHGQLHQVQNAVQHITHQILNPIERE